MLREDIEGVKRKLHKNSRVVMVVGSSIYQLSKQLTKSEKQVLDCLLTTMEYSTNLVIINGETKDYILKNSCVTTLTLKKIISKLNTKGFISKTILPYEYVVNPTYAYTGDLYIILYFQSILEGELK